ncbi:MAG: regulatory protein RecX [Spirochaetaceae bacterium]|nr:MAG: regulatory protein RecX [Spirochaetaceae bacterium]
MDITLSDGSRFFVLTQLLDHTTIETGDTVELEEMRALWLKSERRRVRAKLLDLLSRREYTRRELLLRVQQRNFDSEVSRVVIDELASEGLQDDGRFAAAWLHSRLRRHPEGRGNLLLGLKARGVSSEVAAEALADLDREEPTWEEQALRDALERASRRSDDPERITKILQRNGFAFSQILRNTLAKGT